jgi:serine phosphatase RsbU (regulator of sigma subunit)
MQFSARFMRGYAGAGGFGDFYDVLPLAVGRWGVAVGAVRGDPELEGQLSAGSITVARAVLRATALIDTRPSRVLASLNRALLAWPEGERRYLTAIYATVRPIRRGARVRICVAGPPTGYLRRACGHVTRLAKAGSPLGVDADPHLHDLRLVLRPGDSLILMTESMTNVLTGDDPSLPETGRLPLILAGLDSASAARSTDVIVRAVADASDQRPDQQMVVLALKVPRRRRGTGTHSAGWPGTRRYRADAPPPRGLLPAADAGVPDRVPDRPGERREHDAEPDAEPASAW